MKTLRLFSFPAIAVLLLLLVIGQASAQSPVDLNWLHIKFWPEYDDPRLLVIIDGELANPESEIRIPIPQDAQLNAVATADNTGRLLTNEWKEERGTDDTRILVMTPKHPIFRVEYYAPLAINGDERIIDFELPAGYVNVKTTTIEVLLPPSSKDIVMDPPADESGPTQDAAHLFQRALGEIKDQPIRQKITYLNPSGALTVPETNANTGALLQATPAPEQEPASPAKSPTTTSGINPWILLLGVAAVLLILGGIVGLWMTRDKEEPIESPSPPPSPRNKRKKKNSSKVPIQSASRNLDRFCRHCGKEFGPEDRFCRYCGAKRQSI